jgi:hypothetical protein
MSESRKEFEINYSAISGRLAAQKGRPVYICKVRWLGA